MKSDLHVAIIMDGNGRWAQLRGKDRFFGHVKGANVLRDIIEGCPALGVRYLTVYAFSSENFQRPAQEVSGLMSLFQNYLKRDLQDLHAKGISLRVIGDKAKLDPNLQGLIHHGEKLTKHNDALGLQIALAYGARDEIVNAARKLATELVNQRMSLNDIDCQSFTQALETAPWPDPDLLIRTGGEMRLSNYLLWQLSYTELLFLDMCWPDFTVPDLEQALECYARRSRRFGRV